MEDYFVLVHKITKATQRPTDVCPHDAKYLVHKFTKARQKVIYAHLKVNFAHVFRMEGPLNASL